MTDAELKFLKFCAIQLRGARKHRDYDAVEVWISEILHALHIYDLSEEETQQIVDEEYARMIIEASQS